MQPMQPVKDATKRVIEPLALVTLVLLTLLFLGLAVVAMTVLNQHFAVWSF